MKVIPNILTSLNLVVGCLGITFVALGDLQAFLYCFTACLVLDSLDGWCARLTGNESLLGFYLDAIADVMSFGLMMSIFMCFYIFDCRYFGLLISAVYLVANVVRHLTLVRPHATQVLGITNVVASLFILGFYKTGIVQDIWVWCILICLLSILMVTPIRYFNHKRFKNVIMPQKSIYGLLYCSPLLLGVRYLNVLWWIVVVVSMVYVVAGIADSVWHHLLSRKSAPTLPRVIGDENNL